MTNFIPCCSSLNLQAVGHQPAQALEVDLLGDVLRLDGLLLLDDRHHLTLVRPVVLLDPVVELLVVDVAEELREIHFVDGLEGGANDMADKLANGILEKSKHR